VAKRPRRPRGPADIRWILIPIPILNGEKVDAAVLSRARSEIRDFLAQVEASGREALDIGPHPFRQVYAEKAEEALTIVGKALAGDPFQAFSPERIRALAVLVELGAKAHAVKINRLGERTRPAKATKKAAKNRKPNADARRKRILEICAKNNKGLDEHGTVKWLAHQLKVSTSTIKLDFEKLKIARPRATRPTPTE
jgi:hypothetical protein